jgi:hypothetical protein
VAGTSAANPPNGNRLRHNAAAAIEIRMGVDLDGSAAGLLIRSRIAPSDALADDARMKLA